MSNSPDGNITEKGGQAYRMRLGTPGAPAWSMTKVAALSCDTPSSRCTGNRKFMSGPSVVAETDGSYSLYLGSGDREKPFGGAYFPSTSMVSNYFFKLTDKLTDKPADPAWLASEYANCGANLLCLASFASAGNAADACGATSVPMGKRWALGMRPGEQVVTSAATRFGVTTFSTHMPDVPAPNNCGGRLGQVHVYNLDTGTAAPAGGSTCAGQLFCVALPPAPQKFDVCMDTACTVTRAVCIVCGTDSAIQPREDAPQSVVAPSDQRSTNWYLR